MFPTARRNRWTAGLTPKPSTARKASALRLEQLEVRDTPATFTWTGAGADSNWSNRQNWAGGVAPTGIAANVDDLVFPGTALQKTTTNNITGGVFNTITIGAGGYTLTGRPLTLGGISGAANSGALIVAAAAVNNTLAIDTTLGAAAGNFQSFSINSSAELTVTGRLFGTPGSTLTKDGTGTLVLAADNRGFPGPILVRNNSGTLVAADPNALGTTSSPTTIAAGSALRLRNLSAPLPEPLIVNGLGVSNDGAVSSVAGTANVLSGTVRMDSDAALGASPGTVLTVTGVVSDTSAGFNLFKKGEGEVKLASPTGNTYRLQTFVDNGVLTVTHPRALGADNTPTSGTVVNASLTEFGQLRLEAPANSAGFTVRDEYLTLNGSGLPGLANPGALTNTRGNNDWAGPVTLGSPRPNVANEVTVAAAANTNLTLSGVLASPNLVLPLVKDDAGRVILNNANTYQGTTVVARGALNVRDSSALGTTGNTGGEVQGVQVTGTGTFTLTFNGATTTPIAADASAAQVAAALNALPTIGGVVVNGAPGRVSVVSSPMTGGRQYTVTFGGALTGQDQTPLTAAGANAGVYVLREGGVAATAVVSGAALELEVEALLPGGAHPTDSHGRDLTLDSVTGDPVRLRLREPVTIGGRGLDTTGTLGGLGALRSVAGINTYEALITLATGPRTDIPAAAIGVDRDTRLGHPTPSTAYFTDDYSLTTTGLVAGGNETEFVKRGGGHLIFPFANPYLGVGRVEEGWLTIQDADALGGRIPGRGDTVQPETYVSDGAAVHIRPLVAGTTLTVPENIALNGVGPAHAYNFISRKGALMNLGGTNTWSGDVRYGGQAGVGVEQVVPVTTAPSNSDLTFTGSTTDGRGSFRFSATGDDQEFFRVIDTGSNFGTVSITYEAYFIPDSFRVYYPPRGEPGATAIIDTGNVSGGATVTAPFGPGPSTRIEVVVNEGTGDPGTVWDLFDVTFTTSGGLTKLGSKKLNVRGDGTYTGPTEVKEGTLRIQNDTALGRASQGTATTPQAFIETGTVVSAGAVLEMEESNPREAAGVTAGLQVWHEALTLNRSGQQVGFAGPIGSTFKLRYKTDTVADPFTVTAAGPTATQVRDALATLPAVIADFGPDAVTVTKSGNVYTILFGTALSPNAALIEVVDRTAGAEVSVSGGNFSLVTLGGDHAWRDTVSLVGGPRLETRFSSRLSLLGPVVEAGGAGAVSDLVKRGAGELLLAGANSYRGTTAVDEGVLTVAGERVLGDTVNGTVVKNGAQLQIQGNLTISGEPLTLEGTGPGVVPAFEDTVRWLSAGAGPTNNGHSGNNLPTSGKVTSIATDPSDPDVIYIATAGGGAWKTKNGGRTWVPLFDHPPEGLGTSIFGGSVAVAASDPKVVYFATGDGHGAPTGNPIPGQGDNAAGAGVYKSVDSGHTWTLLVGLDERNPLAGQAITKIIVDPSRSDRIYVASGTSIYSSPLGSVGVPNSNPRAVPGVYRFTGTPGVDGTWFNLTGGPSPNRASVPGAAPYNAPPAGLGPPENAGPDDDYRIKFPQANATWSDILLVKRSVNPYSQTPFGDAQGQEWVLYAALGESNQSYFSALQPKDDATGASTQGIFNAVYRTEDPDTTTVFPTWWLGTGTVFPRAGRNGPNVFGGPIPLPTAPDARGAAFPIGPRTPPLPYQPPGRNGWIKIAGGLDNYQQPIAFPAPDGITNYYIYGAINAHITVYASSAFPDWHDWRGAFQDVQKTGWDGNINVNWAATGTQPGEPVPPDGNPAQAPAYRDLFGVATRDRTLGGPAPIGPEYRNITPGSGRYDHVLLAQDPFGLDNFGTPTPNSLADNDVNVLYIAGQGGMYRSADGGATWTRVDAPGGQPLPNRPAGGYHALALDASNRLYIGTDGGIWRMDDPVTDPTFSNLNGDLVATSLNSADPHPNDLFRLTAGSAGTGTQQTNGELVWDRVDDDTGTRTGVVRYDPLNPQILYAVRDGLLRKSTDGGATWSTLRQVGTAPPGSTNPPANDAPVWNPARLVEVALVNPLFPGVDARADQLDPVNYVPLVVDPINPLRILIGGEKPRYVGGQLVGQLNPQQIVYDNLFQSLDGGLTFTNLNAGITISAIGIATYQGPFVADPDLTVPGVPPPGFPNVADKLSNTYDPDTIYVAGYLPAEGEVRGLQVDQLARNILRVTKDGGVSWVTRTPPGAGPISDIAVDPGNRDVVYVARATRTDQAGGRVYKSDDAGRTWSDVTGSDPDMQVPAHKLTIDPRTGTLYLGNENGVWVLPNASTSSASVWVRLGAGLPRTAVRDIVVNQALNTVTVATAGRGAYQLFLTDYAPSAGALRAVSGSSVWTGPVTLTGPTTISADGNAAIQNGISGATLNIVGVISDAAPGDADNTVTKIGLGTVTFSGTNTYAGQTLVVEGVLQANNPKALGVAEAASNTLVTAGAALELRADLELEPITARGRGFLFNGHFTGSVRNVSNNNTYTGTLTLATDTTIGVDSGTTLTIGNKPGLGDVGTAPRIDDGGLVLDLDKELPGTLVLAAVNTYDGQTLIRQGAVRVEDGGALGSAGLAGGVDTRVLDGAQLQLARNAVTGLETVVAGESLSLSGSGIDKTGAILNVHAAFDSAGATNTWRGPVTFTLDPNTSPPTNPPSQVSLGVDNALDTLVIDGVIDQAPGQTSFGLVKVGPGRVTLTRDNTFTGVTNVDRGALRVQSGDGLGPAVSTEVQTVSVLGSINPITGDPYTFRLSYNGASTLPISATLVDATVIRSKLGALPTVGGANNLLVNETPARGGTVFTITFVNALADADRPQIVAADVSPGLVVNVATPQQGGLGTVVAAGGTLELDGTPTGGFIIDEVLSLAGDGAAETGALYNAAETNTYSGPITLAADAGVGAAAGSTLVVTGTVRDTSPVAIPAPRLRKLEDGTVEVRSSNPYAGRTLVDEGVLRITNRTALGFSGAEVQLVQVTGTNGTFSLTFRGQTTTALPFNAGLGTVATAADVRAALELLTTVGPGGVTVTETGTPSNKTFRVTFAGVLAAANQPTLTASVTGSTSVGVTTQVEGPEGTTVADGATLQLAGGLVFDREVVTINGAGFNGQGALNNFNGNNTFATPLLLGSAAAVGTTAANQVLSITAPIDEADTDPVEEEVYDLDIVGTGTVSYDAAASNKYTGTTTVKNGTLRLNHSAGVALAGPLVVGGSGNLATAVAARDNQVQDNQPVTVNAQGTFNLNGRTDTVGAVTVNAGTVLTGAAGQLTTADFRQTGGLVAVGLNATLTSADLTQVGGTLRAEAGATVRTQDIDTTGGTIDLRDTSTRLALNGGVTATSSAINAPASILGPGRLDLDGADRTFAVTDGPAAEDLRVSAVPVGPGRTLVKAGTGRLALLPTAPSDVTLRAADGDLQADTDVGPVELAGGTLSGVGSVDAVAGVGAAAAAGTVNPGRNWQTNPAGRLTATGNVAWSPATTFFVDLDASQHPNPVAAVDYDQLRVTGSIDLGGAALRGKFNPGVLFGDRFVIIEAAGGVRGTFAAQPGVVGSPGVLFLDGQKFRVILTDGTNTPYPPNDPRITRVVLEKIKADVTVGVTSSANPSTLRQEVIFTATVVPETGAGPIPPEDTVTFVVDGVAYGPFSLTNGQARFSSLNLPGGFLAAGPHDVYVTFSGDALNFFPATSPTIVQVVEAPAIAPLVGGPTILSPTNPTSAGQNDVFTASTTVTQQRATTTVTVTVRNAAGTTVRTYQQTVTPAPGVSTIPVNVSFNGKANDLPGTPALPDGDYTVVASFEDVFGNVAETAPLTIRIDDTSPVSTAPSTPTPVIDPTAAGQVPTAATLTARVTDANLDFWTVTVADKATGQVVRTYTGAAGAVDVNVVFNGRVSDAAGAAALPDGVYTLTVTGRDTARNTVVPLPANVREVVILTAGPVVSVGSNTPTVYGDAITLTTTVSVPFASVADFLIGGSVLFYNGPTLLGSDTLEKVGDQYTAALTVPTFAAGVYPNITVQFPGNETFLPAVSAPHTHTVTPAVLMVTADDQTKAYGSPLPPLTYRATGFVNGDTEAAVLSGGLGTPATAASNVGTYPIEQGELITNGNYTVNFTPGVLTVTPVPLTIRINDATRVFNRPDPVFTATYEGLLLGDTPAVVQGLVLGTTATAASRVGTFPIVARGTPTAQNYTITVIPGTLTITPIPTEIDVGAGVGGVVRRFDPTGAGFASVTPFPGFGGAIRTASADFNKDGIEDYAVATGPGVQARVTVYDGNTDQVLFSTFPFDDFEGGLFLSAGDLTGDGQADLVVTPDEGGGPRVQIYRGGDYVPVINFFGIQDRNFRGGIRTAVGDINADGFADLAVAAGFGGGPRVSIWDGRSLSQIQYRTLTSDFFAFDTSLRNGVYVGIGDLDGDGLGDVFAGAGPGGGPRVTVFSGKSLLSAGADTAVAAPIANFFAGNTAGRGGARVAVKNLDGDLLADLVVGDGEGAGSHVTAYLGKSFQGGIAPAYFGFDAFPGINNGVFVG